MIITIKIIKNIQDENEMINYISNIDENDKKIRFCIDFEFNNKNCGLMQLYITKLNVIYLLSPETFTSLNKEKLIQKIFISSNDKILHGSESLDIPYIYNQLLKGKIDWIIKFTNHLYDTRFICAFLNFPRCNIYQSLINFNLIDNKRLEELKNIESKLGKIWRIHWDASKLTNNEAQYALYDVLYLSKLFKKQKSYAKQKNIKLHTLFYITRLVFLFKQNYLKFAEFKLDETINIDEYLNIEYFKNPLKQIKSIKTN